MRVDAGRAQLGEMALNIHALMGAPETPEALAGAVHIADALRLLERVHTSKK